MSMAVGALRLHSSAVLTSRTRAFTLPCINNHKFLRPRTIHNAGAVIPSCASVSGEVSTQKPKKKQDPNPIPNNDSKSSTHKPEGITPRSQDFNNWYLDVIAAAELSDYGPVRGTMVIRPYGSSASRQEASHVEGFNPELAVVTIGGGKELEEKLVVRPTSETIVNHMFTQWVHSYRDLPLMINQWVNVTRWEMRTKPFLRTLEFLWQEGHTAHATEEEAEKEFTDENGQRQHVWQSSWAVSTRMVGGIIMTHGDDTGLILPPRMAPIQVVIVPIWKKTDEKESILEVASTLEKMLKAAGIRVKLDESDLKTPGWKFNFWEMKGVPLRIEIGPRDVLNKTVVVSRRDVPGKDGKVFGVSMDPSFLEEYVKNKLEEVQSALLTRATAFRDRI